MVIIIATTTTTTKIILTITTTIIIIINNNNKIKLSIRMELACIHTLDLLSFVRRLASVNE